MQHAMVVAILLSLWSPLAYDTARCDAPKRPPDIQQRVRTIRFRGGEGGSHRLEPYHFEEVR